MTNEISIIVSDYLRSQKAAHRYQGSPISLGDTCTSTPYSISPMTASIVASSVANAVGTVIGHPLDTIRVSFYHILWSISDQIKYWFFF